MEIDYDWSKKFWSEYPKEHSVNLGTTIRQSNKQIRALRRLISGKDSRVLELGCGTGRIAQVFEKLGKHIIGVDFSEPCLEKARVICPKGEFHNSEVWNIPPVQLVDVVIISGVLLHLNDTEIKKTFGSINSVLRRGGKLLIRESVGNPQRFEVHGFVDNLGCDYHAVYRTREDIKKLVPSNFNLGSEKLLYQQRPETGTWLGSFGKWC